jgi:hypothetical protein
MSFTFSDPARLNKNPKYWDFEAAQKKIDSMKKFDRHAIGETHTGVLSE